MKMSKTLIPAAFAIVSLCGGAAEAQQAGSGVTVYRNGFYQAPQRSVTQAHISVPVQSGSSDVDVSRPQSPYSVTTQPQFDFSNGSSGG